MVIYLYIFVYYIINATVLTVEHTFYTVYNLIIIVIYAVRQLH